MSEVDITGALLRRIARQNNFALPSEYFVFAGIRGATPVDPDDLAFASARRVRITAPDYEPCAAPWCNGVRATTRWRCSRARRCRTAAP